MQIRHLAVKNFRGIKSLEWSPRAGLVCLVGHGDSTKSTILDAIEVTLAGRYYMAVSELDFFELDTANAIQIDVTLTGFPKPFLSENKYGLHLRGWEAGSGKLKDEPEGCEPALTIRCDIDQTLEPTWRVVADRDEEGKPFSGPDRESLGVMRIGADVNRHLNWGKGSALTRATGEIGGAREIISKATQEARESIQKADLKELQGGADGAQKAAKEMGAVVREGFRPGLGSTPLGVGYGVLALHDGRIPLTASGLGNRRLVALGLEALSLQAGNIVLIDEVETGLEPHRLRHLLVQLRRMSSTGQVFLTTHSDLALIELAAQEISLVRCITGEVDVLNVAGDLQDVVRDVPEALLGKRVLVTEGRTEVGLCRAQEARWATEHGGVPLTHTGAVVVDGDGSKAVARASQLAGLKMTTGLFRDSDVKSQDVNAAWQTSTGVQVFAWTGDCATEQRVALDLPLSDLQRLLDLAVALSSEDAVLAACRKCGALTTVTKLSVVGWLEAGIAEADLRAAVGKAAMNGKWFKGMTSGTALGELIDSTWPRLAGTPLATGLNEVAAWLYG